jgi:hypothetical protein
MRKGKTLSQLSEKDKKTFYQKIGKLLSKELCDAKDLNKLASFARDVQKDLPPENSATCN